MLQCLHPFEQDEDMLCHVYYLSMAVYATKVRDGQQMTCPGFVSSYHNQSDEHDC